MFLVRDVLAALVHILNLVDPWRSVGRNSLAVIQAIVMNLTQMFVVVLLIDGTVRFLEHMF